MMDYVKALEDHIAGRRVLPPDERDRAARHVQTLHRERIDYERGNDTAGGEGAAAGPEVDRG